ncbi:MAG TPA: ribonuclease HII [Stellaceae bacterium]|jgi:ribonuclease HII|nr:ribonuclease HII [Stellaceae bacterium]
MPDFMLERGCDGIVCGIDEAGRGPLAGPVVAAAVILDRKHLPRKLRAELDDSKKLSADEREEYAVIIRRCAVKIGIGAASVGEIDRINILQATFLAMRRALLRLGALPDIALIDGNQPPPLPCAVKTVIGGDGLSLSIAAASVIAKVTRDKLMRALALRYDGYGWMTNVGYGTEQHRAGILALGPTKHHRMSFAPLQLTLDFDSNFAD